MSDATVLYEALGYREPIPRGRMAGGAGLEAAAAAPPEEIPPLDAAGARELEQLLATEPHRVLEAARRVWDPRIEPLELEDAVRDARRALEEPERAAARMRGALEARARPLPADFTFPGMDLGAVPIDPGDTKFETKADALGWVVLSGPQFLGGLLGTMRKHPFVWHGSDGFVYDPPSIPAGGSVEVALLSDFATGRFPARYIARQVVARGFPYLVHLGDTYYAGRKSEFRDNMRAPLAPAEPHTAIYLLNANHEMLSGGIEYFRYIDDRRRAHPGLHRQTGSYFTLLLEPFQLIGIDTAYHRDGRYQEPRLLEWLQERLEQGRRSGWVNVLMSSNEPYEYGKPQPVPLVTKDLAALVRRELVDLWFWGNTHYCALFDRTADFPFIGSCIGHGGCPFYRQAPGQPSAAPVVFLETGARFPDRFHLRLDQGRAGYCTLRLHGDRRLELTYLDWMGQTRFEADLRWDAAAGRLRIAGTVPHPLET
jgi:hypothetical protein